MNAHCIHIRVGDDGRPYIIVPGDEAESLAVFFLTHEISCHRHHFSIAGDEVIDFDEGTGLDRIEEKLAEWERAR